MNLKTLPLAALLAVPAAVQAEEVLSPVVVTASRMAETVDETLAPVSVIEREEIEQRQPPTLLELLRTEPGVDLVRSGGPGSNTSLFLRGTNSEHVLVLIDGVRASSATTGSFSWQHLDPAQVERIEIVRGPRSTLYGSDAIGGVIQIFTRKTEGISGRVEAGSNATRSGQVAMGGGEKVRYRLNASAYDTDGISATSEASPGFAPDDDGYRNRSVSGSIEFPLGQSAELNLNSWYSAAESEFDQGTQDSTNAAANARLGLTVSDSWYQTLAAGFSLDEVETESAFPSTIETERTSLNWKNELALGASDLLLFGVDYYRDEGRNRDDTTGTTQFDKDITNRAAYLSWRTENRLGDFQAGARYDRHSEFGNETTGQLAFGRDLTKSIRLLTSYGTAFKAPTLNQLFHPGFGGFFAGNPELEPETSASTELGLRFTPEPSVRMEANAFYTEVENLIAYEGTDFQAININQATIRGLELTYSRQLQQWSFETNFTYQKARNREDDSPLLRRPDRKLALSLVRRLNIGGSLTMEGIAVGERHDLNEVVLPGYGLVNIAWQYPLSRGLQLEGRVENLGDREYELASGYNTVGRSYFLALRYAPAGR